MNRDSIVLICTSLHGGEYRCRLCMLYDINNCIEYRKIHDIDCCCKDFKKENDKLFGFDNTKDKILQLSTGRCNLNKIMCPNEECTSNIENCPKLVDDNVLEF